MIWNGEAIERLDKIKWGALTELLFEPGSNLSTLRGDWVGRGVDHDRKAIVCIRPATWGHQLLSVPMNDVREVVVIDQIKPR